MSPASDALRYRLATPADIPALHKLIADAVLGLMPQYYTAHQLQHALGTWLGLDTQLIVDQTYFVVEADDSNGAQRLIACGGWSKRKTPYGADKSGAREDALLDPAHDAAKIRAFFVHPDWARRGIGSGLLALSEGAARAYGFARAEMGATLSGVPLYQAKGYRETSQVALPLEGGDGLVVVLMGKDL